MEKISYEYTFKLWVFFKKIIFESCTLFHKMSFAKKINPVEKNSTKSEFSQTFSWFELWSFPLLTIYKTKILLFSCIQEGNISNQEKIIKDCLKHINGIFWCDVILIHIIINRHANRDPLLYSLQSNLFRSCMKRDFAKQKKPWIDTNDPPSSANCPIFNLIFYNI